MIKREIERVDLLTVFPELPRQQLKLPAEDPFGYRRSNKPLFATYSGLAFDLSP
jgi:hypothetical protein